MCDWSTVFQFARRQHSKNSAQAGTTVQRNTIYRVVRTRYLDKNHNHIIINNSSHPKYLYKSTTWNVRYGNRFC